MGSSSSSSLNNSPIRADSMVTPESQMTVNDNKNDNVSILSPSVKKSFESPRKSTSIPANNNLTPVKSRWSFSSSKKSFGSKDETFFDSQPWLQSDSDDDFHSVNGDFTPSLGNTPKSSFSDRPPRFHNLIFHEKKPSRGSSSPAPLPRRKKLGELFRDSIREEREESGSSSAISTPYLSGANSREFNDTAIEKEEKKKSNWHHHRCLPGFSSCGGSFMERRKKMSSETPVVAVK
ncbi:hypothetical protein AtNW77_Chr3g0187561 [Arabidopsis thaliana]|uniref:Uncharacterized protein At3g27210 n=3 Tax=Arabidopsis TaxID=3701 RepID=Y3721_ARATH|nr:uncharacterized protein AT3G27210 [Arabidopsis thaliana]Q9LK32.1 RecName: Full=Uncharacterized protein At3g27210 [Arabidopsis thaliana]KAG7626765.1 hypothetical protein ISN45_At03g028870 [Arabidopsis thaliana x Arabidopsis arenosa]AAK83575.1 AT3g27210/K17E12_3 [Arabidopsis thaliana]AAL79601.1 AT3g27210/K17E12_3 [Arabidopsis thaliana]AEE77279.1 hypothetical protein AT3G27210 [Arabidopsis thaliana]OAP01252.1 hypothetical protein AXX17_AT3G29650 [Arabidopsis thaliana]|eukprot:NP_566811.1 hypothetical protein AT3G27210 [Arabidopsis thaliana]